MESEVQPRAPNRKQRFGCSCKRRDTPRVISPLWTSAPGLKRIAVGLSHFFREQATEFNVHVLLRFVYQNINPAQQKNKTPGHQLWDC